jgi:hypothetical protein
VLYKLLERYHYLKLLKELEKVLKAADGDISTAKDVKGVEKAVKADGVVEELITELTTAVAAGPYEVPLGATPVGRQQWRKRKKKDQNMKKTLLTLASICFAVVGYAGTYIDGVPDISGGGGIWCWDGNRGYIKNCIVYGNTSDDPTYKNIYHDGDLYRVTYTCTTNPVFIGNNCTSSDPLLTADYKLGVGSSCIDVGTNETWMIDVMDLGGNDRKIYGEVYGSELDPIVDMGTYEYLPTEPVTLRNLLVPVDREILRERNVFWP